MAQTNRISVPLSLAGGQFSAGDAGNIPDGYVRLLQNYLPRANRIASRPPFAYDNLMAINSLANFDDPTNRVTRLVAINTSAALFLKSATVETWSASLGTISGTRLTDYCNYRGKLYGMMDNGAGLPSTAFSFDGTNTSTTPFNSLISARTVTVFNDRLFFAYPRVAVLPLTAAPTTHAYNWTNAANWSATNVTTRNTTIGASTTACRLSPTSTTTNGCSIIGIAAGTFAGLVTVAASTSDKSVIWRSDIRGVDPTYNVPVTFEMVLSNNRGDSTAYVVGDLVTQTATSQFRWRATVAGTTGVGTTLNATVGSTTTDGTVTWLNEGSNILGSVETNVQNITDSPMYRALYLETVVPPRTNSVTLSPRLKFYNTANPALTTLAPIDISLKDGIADGDPSKKNYGQQWTLGDFRFPFFNTETATSATVDMASIVWSEISDPKRIRAANTYEPQEAIGFPTAAITTKGRYHMFKRNVRFTFAGQDDPDNPIVRESVDLNIGCLGPRALDVYEDIVFSIGENDIYADNEPFCGDGMRETIMSKGANWVESQSTYKRPLLSIDKKQLIVWVYTQKSKLYAYDLRSKVWSEHTTPNSAEVDSMMWNPNTGNFYVAFGGNGIAKMDYVSTGAKDTIESVLTERTVTPTIIFRPIELSDPMRYDALLESVHIYHAATASQSGQTLKVHYSTDQGTTYPKSDEVAVAPLSAGGEFLPIPLPAGQMGPSLTVKLVYSGKTGEATWAISPRAYATIQVKRGEYPQVNPTAVSASL